MVLLVLILYILLIISINYIIWWSIIIFISILGLINMKLNNSSSMGIVLYFIVQELIGIIFIISSSIEVSFLVLITNGGFAPLHFWIINVVNLSCWLSFAWIITIQKLPYYFIVMCFWSWNWLFFLLLGSILPLLQVLLIKSINSTIFLLLTSSGNNLLLLGGFEILTSIYIFLVYLILIYYILNSVSITSYMTISHELLYLIIGFPGGVPFFLNLFILYLVFNLGGIVGLLILLSFVLNIVGAFSLVVHFYTLPRITNKLFISLFFMSLVVLLL